MSAGLLLADAFVISRVARHARRLGLDVRSVAPRGPLAKPARRSRSCVRSTFRRWATIAELFPL